MRKKIKTIIENALYEKGLSLEMDEYLCGNFNGKPFRFNCNYQMDFVTSDNFDRFANSDYISFDVTKKSGLRKMVSFIQENTVMETTRQKGRSSIKEASDGKFPKA